MDIKEALLTLDPENKDLWTSDGLPLVDVMRELTGNKELVRQQITDADPEFCRNKASVRNDTPPSEPSGPELETAVQKPLTKLELDEQINNLRIKGNALNGQISHLQRMRDRLQEEECSGMSSRADTEARLAYIKSQRKIRAQRSARGRQLLQILGKENLDPRSRLDQAMSRKTQQGTQRPVRPTTTST